jgi:hypothetical protein
VQKLHFSYNVTIDDRDFLVKQKSKRSAAERGLKPVEIVYGFRRVERRKPPESGKDG